MIDSKKCKEMVDNYTYINNIKKYIKDIFPIAIYISRLCPVYLMGGSLRDIKLGNIPKNLDFVCLDNDNIIEAYIKKFNLEYKLNSFGGYKIKFNGMSIDLWKTSDLYSAIEYNIDGLFYDVKENRLLSFGYFDSISDGIKVINEKNNTTNKVRARERKIKLENYYRKIKEDEYDS